MGNTGWRHDDRKEVVLCLHSVHNVQHSPNESYYGMATDHASGVEVPVTSERPARLVTGIDTVLSVRVFLHNRGSPSSSDRPVGQLSIPVREVLDTMGPGMYQTWFLLDPAVPYGNTQRAEVVERFRRALHGLTVEMHTSRICLTLLESSADPAELARAEEKDRMAYHSCVLVSHNQHRQMVQAHLDHLDRAEAGQAGAKPAGAAPVEASSLRSELERLQQRQRDEELGQLRHELQQIRKEANKRIERDHAAIVKLESELRQPREVEGARLQRERDEAQRQLEALRGEGSELRARVEADNPAEVDAELAALKQEVMVLGNQKAALMKMVQEVYGAHAGQFGAEQTPAQAAAARATASIAWEGALGGGACAGAAPRPANRLLPEAHELLDAGRPHM